MHNSSAPGDVRLAVLLLAINAAVGSCAWFHTELLPEPPSSDRLTIAILGFGMDITIRNLSSVKTVNQKMSPEEEAVLVQQEVAQITNHARQIFHETLEARGHYNLLSLGNTDAVVSTDPNKEFSLQELVSLHTRLGADLAVTGTILDYGKVRWQWMTPGMLGDMTWESIAIGLATAWNPVAIFGNIGFELLTSTPVWFGGGYLFGAAFRPVRVEAQAVDLVNGEVVWSDTEVATFAWNQLKQVAKEDRSKKEVQLRINLNTVMERLAAS